MTQQDLIPRKDGEFNDFQDLLMTTVTANAVVWSIPAGEVTTGTTLKSAWDGTYARVINPVTKTKPNVEAKNNARDSYKAWMRPFLQRYIVLNPILTDADRVALGLKPRDHTRTRVPVPTTTVQLDLAAGHGSTVKVLFHPEADAEGNSHRGKPKGVAQCEIVFKADAPAPVSPDECNNYKVATDSPLLIGFASAQAGKRLYVFARWLNSRNEGGPWTTVPASIIIPG